MNHSKHAKRWIGLVLGIFTLYMTAAAALVMHAANDPGFAVEEQHYDKALRWDEHAARRAQSDALGWRIGLHVGPPEGTSGARTTRAVIVDADGAPLEGAEVRAVTFHNARAREKTTLEFSHTGGGVYETHAPFRRPGLWEFRFEATRGDQTYTSSVRIDVEPEKEGGR